MSPNKANIALWVEALRSGKFDQTTGSLRTREDKYCCLGVACEVAMANGVEVDRKIPENEQLYYYSGMSGYMPQPVREWFGFEHGDPDVGFANGGPLTATTANDISHHSFTKIADLLEEHYLGEETVADND